MLANVTSNICPSNDFSHDKFFVELIYRPLILDNITNWSIFEYDEQIIKFLYLEDTLKGSVINDKQHEALLQASALEDKPEYRKFMQKNIIRIEKLFDLPEKFKRSTNTKIRNSSLRYKVVNLGIEQNPQNINLGTNCTHAKKATLMKLFKGLKDVFAWNTNILRLMT